MLRFCAVLGLAILAIASLVIADDTKDEEVILVQITHRHGARTALVPGDKSTPGYDTLERNWCGDLGCGILTHDGKMMLQSLGNFLRARYGSNSATPASLSGATPVKPSQVFLDTFNQETYHMRRFRSRSTQVLRTMQSADAVIRGVVNNLADVYPVVHTVEYDRDTLLHPVTALSQVIPYKIQRDACLDALPIGWPNKQGVSPSELRAVAKELGMPEGYAGSTCWALSESSSIYDWIECAHPLWGATACFKGQGRSAEIPTALKHFDAMGKFANQQRYCAYANTTQKQGAILYQLAHEMTTNMIKRMDQLGYIILEGTPATEKNHTTLIYEYSAHDTTVGPLGVALGNDGLLLPRFGEAIITELIFDKKQKDSGGKLLTDAFFVRHWLGAPSTIEPPAGGKKSTPADYPYVFKPMQVKGLDDIGTVFNSTTSVSFYAFQKYIEKKLKPTDPAGAQCYLPKSMLEYFGCKDRGPLPNTTSLCATYRKMCPGYACYDEGYIVSLDVGMNLTCVPTSHSFDVSLPALNGIMWGTGVGGGVVGLIVAATMHLVGAHGETV